MIILPDRNIPRARILMPVRASEWREPSRAMPKDEFGNPGVRTRFRLTARTHDGKVMWRGWFDDRNDADAFLFALVSGSLRYERELWRMPTPEWHPGISIDYVYEFVTQTFLTSPTGSNQTYTSPSDWNNASNEIQTVGAGGSGAAATTGVDNLRNVSGGGGGAWNKIVNFSFASPGTTTATYRTGTGGTAVSDSNGVGGTTGIPGNTGGDTWFNGTTLAGSSVGSKGGNGGTGTSSATLSGAAGGVGTSGVGTSSANGGAAGSLTTMASNTQNASGGGGAGGPNGAGNAGTSATSGTDVTTNGGSGDAGSGGSAGSAPGGAGGNGTEWSASYGSGGGGAGNRAIGGSSSTAGSGGNYGGGGGGASGRGAGTQTSGAGIGGIIYIEYTPGTIVTTNLAMMGM